MRKILAVIITLFAITMMTSCDAKTFHEGNVTPDLSEAAFEAKAAIMRLKMEVEDDVFWESTDRAAKLIESTIEDRVNMMVGFRLACSDGSIIYLDDFDWIHLNYINDVWRSKTSSEIIYKLATSDEVVRAHEAGETVEITGIILKWKRRKDLFDSNEQMVYSVCDLENDGNWNYVVGGKVFFTDVSSAALKDENGKILGVGVIDIEPTLVVPVEENADLHGLYELVKVKD